MKAPGFTRIIAGLIIAILCSGCVHDRYMALIGPLEKVGIVHAGMRHVRLVAFDRETGKSLAGFRMTILSRHAPCVVESDANGNIDLPVSPDLERENPAIVSNRENVGMAPEGYGYKTYEAFVRPFETGGAITRDVTRLRVQVTTPAGKTPIEGFRLAVLSANDAVVLTSDSHGMILVPVSSALKRENPLVMTDYRDPVTFYYCGPGNWSVTGLSLGAAIRGMIENSPVQVSTKGMWETVTGDFTVWYCPEYASQAKKAEEILARQYETIHKTTGLNPVKWGVIIYPGAQDDMPCVVSCAESGCAAWCYSSREVEDGRFAQINAHEWTESTIDGELRIYRYDRSNRFIGDGLAEYVSCLSVKAAGDRFGRADDVADYLRWLEDSGVRRVNLLKDFRSLWVLFPTTSNVSDTVRKEGRLDGYGLSLVFWNRLVLEHGDDLPKRFIERLQTVDKRDSTAAIKALEDLTGEKDIRKRLTEASIDDAIHQLHAMAPEGAKPAKSPSRDAAIAG